jgi:serine carboxypeptidase-like clade 2
VLKRVFGFDASPRNFEFAGLHIVVYSGDVDAVVPITGTRRWIESLDQPIKKRWHPWVYENQVAGFKEDYGGLSLLTVRGAGHMVPYSQPARALALFRLFLSSATGS